MSANAQFGRCVALWLVLSAIGHACVLAGGSAQTAPQGLVGLAPNAARDLGRYRCDQPADDPKGCEAVTDYSRFIYDPINRQLLMFGGGYAATHRTDVDVFDLGRLSWQSGYPSTACAAMRVGNVEPARGAWRSTGHPIARHTYDMLVVVDAPPRLVLLNRVTGAGGCAEKPPSGAADPYRADGKIAIYDLASKLWTYSRASAGDWEPSAASEWDPVSRKVVVIDSHFLWTYDPDTQEKQRHAEHTSQVQYGKNLVYFPPNDRMYYIADGPAVFEVALDRVDFARSTIKLVTGISGDIPSLRETGFAYDSAEKVIGGGVRDGIFYAYAPISRTWVSRRIEAMPKVAVGSVAFHALDYDPVSNVFLFLTDWQSGRHMWAFRFSSAHGTDAGPSRSAPPAWPGVSVCPPSGLLQVGPMRPLALPSWAARCARDGDIIEIDAGLYIADVAIWTQSNLTIRGVGGRPHLKAAGATAEGKGIWVIKGRNTTIENVEFSGAAVDDGNGAAIRLEGRNLAVRHCYFHDSQEGLLTGGDPEGEVLIESSEFARHGFADGQSHNIYVGAVKKFTLRYSYVHHAKVGHNVKSRARETVLAYNRIMDEVDGNSSYGVDIPNGGRAYLIGNVIQHGTRAENPAIVSYGAEGLMHSDNELYVVNNTIVSDRSGRGVFIQTRGSPSTIQILNNILTGPGTPLDGPGDLRNNLVSENPGFRDRSQFDYRLIATSPAIDGGVAPGSAHGVKLAPEAEYVHPAGGAPRPRVGPIDIGAYEYVRSER